MDEELSAEAQVHATLMRELGPLTLAYADALRGENPSWTFEQIYEQTRRRVSDALDEVMSGLVEAVAWRREQDGDDVYARYVEELSVGATLHQPDKVAPLSTASLEEWRDRRICWWWYNEVVTAASRWIELDEPLRQTFIDGLVDHIPLALHGGISRGR
jgi:hypothetical protein